MSERRWIYLYDEKGEGPLSVSQLPQDVTELRDDPYRSLAWKLRKVGGYRKTNFHYSEFTWANFFRTFIDPWSDDADDFESAVMVGVELAKSPLAKELPGYVGETLDCRKKLLSH